MIYQSQVATRMAAHERRFFTGVVLLVYAVWLAAFEAVGRYAMTLPTIDITSSYDRAIPLVPAFIWIYQFCYVFPLVPLFVLRDWHRFNRLLMSVIMANVIAFVVYLVYPVAIPRPELGNTISERLLAFTYAIDFHPAVTMLPSLHVTFAWLVFYVCRKQINKWVDAVILSIAVGISISTLFVKQHLIVDVVAGFCLATASWMTARYLYPLLTNPKADAQTALRQLTRRLIPTVPLFLIVFFFLVWYQ